jgi:cystathionine beta-lyase/cystathionine gamma-synthase
MSRGAGAVLSFETGNSILIEGDVQKSEKIVEAARLWLISVSFGCVNSLIRLSEF